LHSDRCGGPPKKFLKKKKKKKKKGGGDYDFESAFFIFALILIPSSSQS